MPFITSGNVISSSAQLGAGVVKSTAILDGEIVNADINAAAAIALSKITGAAASGANSDITSLASLSTPLTVAQGGNGVATLNAHGVQIGNGTSAVNVTTAGTAGQVLKSNGAALDPTFQDNTLDWQQVGQTINGGAQTTLSVGSIPARKHYKVYIFANGLSADTWILRFNADSGANYSHRYSLNGAAQTTAINQTSILLHPNPNFNGMWAMLEMSVAAGIVKTIKFTSGNSEGVATAPDMIIGCGNWQNTASAITTITITSATNIPAGAIMTVYASKD